MTMDQAINVLVTITLIEMMVATGLGTDYTDLAAVVRNWRLVIRAVLANYVAVPALVIGLLYLFDPHPMVAAGFLLLAVCPGAPYGPPCTALAKGDVTTAVGLMVILAGSSALVAPALLHFLLPVVAGSVETNVDAIQIVATLLLTQLVPLGVGMVFRSWRPKAAQRLQKPANSVSKLLNLAAIGLIVFAQLSMLSEIRLRGFLGMLILLALTWATSWLIGGWQQDTNVRKAMVLTTSLRNLGVALVIASSAFAGTPAVTATLAFGLVSILGSLGLALVWPRIASP